MKLRVEPTENGMPYPSIEVSYPDDNLDISEFLDELVRPVMLAMGYPASIVETIRPCPEDDDGELP